MTVRTSRRETRGWRTRFPVLLVVAACVAAVVAAVTGVANPVNATQFLTPGHWVFNVALGTAFHVDGATAGIDARVPINGDQGSSQVVQGDTSGYVVGSSRLTEFGKSSLEVVDSTEPPAAEAPVALEAAGGVYLVYRKAGKVVRFGQDRALVLATHGPVGDPVATSDGTVWLPRTDAGLLCQLARDADNLTCPVLVPKGHSGGLTVVDDRVMFVDTTDDVLRPVESDGLGDARPLGLDVPDSVRFAADDVSGRIAILDQDHDAMHLVDAAGDERPVTVPLGKGDFEGPVSTGTVVAVVDRATDTLSTYDSHGKQRATERLPAEQGGDPRLSRGEDDRVYVDGAEGEHVMVVDDDGSIAEVPVQKAAEEGDQGDKDKDDKDKGDKDKDSDKDKPDDQDAQPGGPAGGEASPPENDPRSGAPEGENPKPDVSADSPPVHEPPPTHEEPPPAHEQGPEQPPPVAPSPPGVPPSVRATAGNAVATVRWGTAPDNRAPVTRYNISWTGGGGQHGSTTAGGKARTTKVTGLTNGVRYTFTVSATNSAGTGPGAQANAVTPAAPKPTPKITVSRGPDSTDSCEGPPDCALMHVVLTDFAPYTAVHIQPHSSNPSYHNGGADLTTDANGGEATNRFAYEMPGDQVWVTVGTVKSNVLTWTSKDGGTGGTKPTITVSRGADSESDKCRPPDCSWMHIVLTGFEPNTEYDLTGWASEWDDWDGNELVTTGPEGNAVFDDMRFDGGGQYVWVFTDTPDGRVESNHYFWEDR